MVEAKLTEYKTHQAKWQAQMNEFEDQAHEFEAEVTHAERQASRYDLGEALYKIGQYKRATEELQQSLKQPSVRYQALNLMGLAFMKRGMLDFAVKQLAMAESELPVMDEVKKEITYNLGLAYEVIKQPEKSLEQWKKIYEVDMSYRDVGERVEASYGGGDHVVPFQFVRDGRWLR